MCTCKVRLNINTQLIITALKFTDFPDNVSKDYDYNNELLLNVWCITIWWSVL
jgi:hypothetical protein